MPQFGFHVNIKNCIACRACEAACKQEFDSPKGVRRRRVVVQEGETAGGAPAMRSISLACNHCTTPACVNACPTGRLHKDMTTGLVLIKPSKAEDPDDGVDCAGCQRCIAACPYGAPQWDPIRKVSDKCTGCDHRLRNTALPPERRVPACVLTCTSFALEFDPDISQIQGGKFGTANRMTSPIQGMADIADPSMTDPNIRFSP